MNQRSILKSEFNKDSISNIQTYEFYNGEKLDMPKYFSNVILKFTKLTAVPTIVEIEIGGIILERYQYDCPGNMIYRMYNFTKFPYCYGLTKDFTIRVQGEYKGKITINYTKHIVNNLITTALQYCTTYYYIVHHCYKFMNIVKNKVLYSNEKVSKINMLVFNSNRMITINQDICCLELYDADEVILDTSSNNPLRSYNFHPPVFGDIKNTLSPTFKIKSHCTYVNKQGLYQIISTLNKNYPCLKYSIHFDNEYRQHGITFRIIQHIVREIENKKIEFAESML